MVPGEGGSRESHGTAPSPGARTPALLELIDAERRYRRGESEVWALRGVSVTVQPGEMVAITGASGSGKSTLLHILGTLDRPDAGRYVFDGVPVENASDEVLSRLRNEKIGFVFQQFHLLPRQTALENVELPMVYAGVARRLRRRRAEEALARVGLVDRLDHRPTELSGGQQQRVAIARALVNRPLLLLADEPTGALDSETSRSVMALLSELHAGGLTIVVVTHDAGIAGYAGRVVAMRDGRVCGAVERGEDASLGVENRESSLRTDSDRH